jgi:hypothetical protein
VLCLVGNIDQRAPCASSGGCLSPCTAPSLLLWGACGGKGVFHRPYVGRRGAQISSERRPVALADVAVYVGGRRAACRRKMGAVTLKVIAVVRTAPLCRHCLHRALLPAHNRLKTKMPMDTKFHRRG